MERSSLIVPQVLEVWQISCGFYIMHAANELPILHTANCRQEPKKHEVAISFLFAQSPSICSD